VQCRRNLVPSIQVESLVIICFLPTQVFSKSQFRFLPVLCRTMFAFKDVTTAINARISRSTFGRVFRLQGCGHVSPSIAALDLVLDAHFLQEKERKGSKFLTEIRAGLTTFFTMAYIIAVNVCFSPPSYRSKLNSKASVLTDTGGTCVCTNTVDPTCATDAEYATCLIGLC
jgi:AGZA family xanthine/uracil permease-like MFS transporter